MAVSVPVPFIAGCATCYSSLLRGAFAGCGSLSCNRARAARGSEHCRTLTICVSWPTPNRIEKKRPTIASPVSNLRFRASAYIQARRRVVTAFGD